MKKYIKYNWETLNLAESIEEILHIFSKVLSNVANKKREEILKKLPKDRRKSFKQFDISPKRLEFLSGQDNIQKQYHSIDIPKKRGDVRTLNIPSKKLRFVQRSILDFLSISFEPHKTAFGFVKERSIVDNANLHINKKYIVCFDIKEFFPNITANRVYGMLQCFPFNASANVARIITNFATYYDEERKEKVLPQGAPTSPYLANMLCRQMDSRIFNFFKNKNVHYSRYADDLTFSTNDYKKINLIKKNVPRFIQEEGFIVNKEKTRIMPYYKRQLVTGIIVNKKVSLPREYIRGLRALLFNIEKFGWESQVKRNILTFEEGDYSQYLNFQKDINPDENNSVVEKLSMQEFNNYNKSQKENHLLVHGKYFIDLRLKSANYTRIEMLKMIVKGKIDFLGMVRNVKKNNTVIDDKIYKNLNDKFELLKLMIDEKDIKYIEVYRDFENIIKNYIITRTINETTKTKIQKDIHSLKKLDNNKYLFAIVQNKVSSIFHDPNRTSEILIKFHKDDNVLKYTNHDWDKNDADMKFLSNADYPIFAKMLNEKWSDYNNEFYSINNKIGAKIYNFIKYDNPSWISHQTNDRIKMGWGHPDFITWINQNSDKKPDKYRLHQKITKTDGDIISSFEKLRELFNKEIRIKDGLYETFNQIRKKEDFKDLDIELIDEEKFRSSYEIYTDVYWFKEGVEEVLKHFLSFTNRRKENKKKVEISLSKGNKKLIITILHVNSYPNSDSKSSSFDEYGAGHLSRFKAKFFSICDWAIESRFEDGAYRFNYLTSENRELKEKVEEESILGFKHILTFYEVS